MIIFDWIIFNFIIIFMNEKEKLLRQKEMPEHFSSF